MVGVVSPIPQGVRESMQIVATRHALFGTGGRPMSEADVSRVVQIFESNHAAWALVGAHAVGLLTQPRATGDFDFIVESQKMNRVIRDLEAEFGDLGQRDIGGAVELAAISIDLIHSANHPLFGEALRQVRTVGDWKVPRTEVLIALKFLASISPWRNRDKRALDIVDLRAIYHAVGDQLDRDELIRLGGLAYPEAAREFGELLDKIDRGEPLSV